MTAPVSDVIERKERARESIDKVLTSSNGQASEAKMSNEATRSAEDVLADVPRLTEQKRLIEVNEAPMRIKAIQFSIMSPQEMASAAHIEVTNPKLYEELDRSQVRGGLLDPRLGAINKRDECETCHRNMQDCIGHCAFIRLRLPVFHAGFFKATVQFLQMICKYCSRVLIEPRLRRKYLASLRNPAVSAKSHIRGSLLREVWEKSRKVHNCHYCHRRNGTVKKVAALKIIHYPSENKPTTKKKDEDEEEEENDTDDLMSFVDPALHMAVKSTPELRKHVLKAADDLNPLRVLRIFERIPTEDVQLLDMDPRIGRPERMLVQNMPVPPLCVRPTVCADPSQGSNEDDLTMQARQILEINVVIGRLLEMGDLASATLFETWDHLQFEITRYINADQPGLPMPESKDSKKPVRGVSQRLKGKTGRFRGNLSGKRVDFSGRTVISPDPNLRIDQVGIPIYVAKILTFPERVTSFSLKRLKKAVQNGPEVYPGANFIESKDGTKRFLKYGDRRKISDEMKYGDIVERHLIEDDVVLFNRQPSLHRISIMAHRVKISPHRTFRFNECVCSPYNADFDGDEMNVHVPQTHEARAEALELMGVVNNILTPKNGEPLVAATQDFITAAYLVTSKSVFMDRAEFCRVLAMISNAEFSLSLPPPTILKPIELWTGKQVMSTLVKSAALSAGAVVGPTHEGNESYRDSGTVRGSLAHVTTEVKEKACKMKTNDIFNSAVMCMRDAYVCFRGGELMCGQVGKKSLGDGSKNSILYVLGCECGSDASAYAMNRLARFAARWHSDNGFSIGVDDVAPSAELQKVKKGLIDAGYKKSDEHIEELRLGTIELRPGCTAEESLETILTKVLSDIRDQAGNACIADIDVSTNAALTMALAGSKGSAINISQMVACVGQQSVGGRRAPDGFFGRALPHFELGLESRTPAAKGFVSNSFFTGMTATEFFMHAQTGREGLTDTAVKTAETGYMQRRLVKALEDLCVQYDDTVRGSTGAIVQVCYGDDGLDPMLMEGNDGEPVNFERTIHGVTCSLRNCDNDVLSGDELKAFCLEELKELWQDLRSAKLIPPDDECNRGGLEQTLKATEKYLMELIDQQKEHGTYVRLGRNHVREFLRRVQAKVRQAEVEPGTAVGAISAQSIGEPGTQMTLKTFHFAGVASMNITQGVPRLKEIINASKTIATPCITAQLVSNNVQSARIVKGRVESTKLGEIAVYIKEVYRSNDAYIAVRLDMNRIHKLQLDIGVIEAAIRIASHKFSKVRVTVDDIVIIKPDKLRIRPFQKLDRRKMDSGIRARGREARKKEMEGRAFFQLQTLKQQLGNVCVYGISCVSRAVISEKKGRFELLVESDNVLGVMVVPGVEGTKLMCNHIMAVEESLGIEAARQTILNEIQTTMSSHGLSVAEHHLKLLADCMTTNGTVLGITRFGIQKMRSSTLMLASFEMTVDHLFDAAIHSRVDAISGVSERIIMGVPIPVGTGLFELLKQTKAEEDATLYKRKNVLLEKVLPTRVNI